ncbi:MAG: hypothetical protein ACRC7N_04335 [Clostridium sp.]
MRKLIGMLTLTLTIVGFTSVIASADSGQNVALSFNSYAGTGFVNGSSNGQYYSLTPGNVTLDITNTNGGFSIELRRNLLIGSTGYGVKGVGGNGKKTWYVDSSSSKYWITAFSGEQVYTKYSLSGKMHDHGM